MPNRMMRDSCRTSTTLDGLSSDAERLFWRLVTVADDYGRLEADPRIVLAQAFPLRVGTWKPAQVARWFAELVAAGILRRYEAGGKALAYFVTWEKHQRARAKESKFAPPDTFAQPSESAVLSDDSTCQHPTAHVAVVVVEDVDVDVGGTAPKSADGARTRTPRRLPEPLPTTFVLTDDRAARLIAAGCLDPPVGFEAFRNHHVATGKRMLDWDAALRTWIGNHARYGCPCQVQKPKGRSVDDLYPRFTDEVAS